MELKRLFCLLMCCELSAILALGNTFSSGIEDKTEKRWSRLAFRKVLGYRELSDLKTDPGFKQLHPSVAITRSSTNQSCTHALYTKCAYRRAKRAALDQQEFFKSKSSEVQKLEPHPKPSAQNLPTDVPAQNEEVSTFPEEDYEDSTPFIPISSQPKGPALPNPFYPLTGESFTAYTILLVSVIMFTAGIIGNITIMCTVCNNYYMRSVSNSLLANLALWDFLICFFCLPLVIFHHLTKDWLLGDLSCKLIPYIEVASLGITTFTLCALCIDRYRAASNVQMYYETIENCASTTAKLAVIWLGALLLALPELLIHQLVTEEREAITEVSTPEPLEVPAELPPCERCVMRISTALPDSLYVLGLTYDSARLWWHFGCYFCLPTVFTIVCSVVTAQKMRQAERTSVRGKREQILFERRMNCTVVALAILYGFCVIPENVCNVISAYMAAGMAHSTLDVLHLISQMLLFCKSAVMPALLLALCKPFSQTFLHCCCCCLEECGLPKSSNGTSDDNENEGNTELELSPYSTVHREEASCTSVGTHCS